jgi:predicted alpha/beta hydrolase
METLTITKADGTSIVATAFTPHSPKERAVLISAATGVAQKFYYNFAAFFAAQGYHVYTYDYTGIGLSLEGKVRDSEASYTTWGSEDYAAMVWFLRARHSAQPLYVVGHSFGGNCIGTSAASLDVSAFVTVAAQQGYWRRFHRKDQTHIWFVFAISIPLLTKLFGYFPSKTHGLGENLPKRVAADWSKIILNESGVESLVNADSSYFRQVTQPMLMISIDDDQNATRQAVDKLAECYASAQIERKHIFPSDVNAGVIGHIDFFRKKFQATLWQIPLEWLEKQAVAVEQHSRIKAG